MGGVRVMLSRCGAAAAGLRPHPGASLTHIAVGIALSSTDLPKIEKQPANMVKQVPPMQRPHIKQPQRWRR